MKEQGLIFEIQRFSTEDGPGIRTTVFMKHCPLKCVWCHNPESILKKQQIEWLKHKCIGCRTCIDTCQLNALILDQEEMKIDRNLCNSCGECVNECPSTALHMFGKWWELEDLFEEINKDKIYYDTSKGGITISGGEPTLQPKFLLNLLKKCKDNKINTALDTCGYFSRETFKSILPYIDLFLFDIKEINAEKHIEYTGVSNERILKNVQWISNYQKKNDKKIWIRTPIIPNYTANEENIREIGEFIVNKLNNVPEQWDLLAFNNLCASKYQRLNLDWVFKDEPLMFKEQMESLYEIARSTGVKNPKWSGLTKK